jgi:CHASE1-domain containing sensor protein
LKTRDRLYAKSRNYFENFSGALGFGFIRKIEARNLEKYLSSKKNEYPKLKIRTLQPKNPRDDFYIIESIEPLSSNKEALGLDISTEKNRYFAAIKAAKSGLPIITSTIQLVQLSQKEAGFLFYHPVYKTIMPPQLEKERLKNIVGWAYAPVVFSKIF